MYFPIKNLLLVNHSGNELSHLGWIFTCQIFIKSDAVFFKAADNGTAEQEFAYFIAFFKSYDLHRILLLHLLCVSDLALLFRSMW